jgi:hypothetical protein
MYLPGAATPSLSPIPLNLCQRRPLELSGDEVSIVPRHRYRFGLSWVKATTHKQKEFLNSGCVVGHPSVTDSLLTVCR